MFRRKERIDGFETVKFPVMLWVLMTLGTVGGIGAVAASIYTSSEVQATTRGEVLENRIVALRHEVTELEHRIRSEERGDCLVNYIRAIVSAEPPQRPRDVPIPAECASLNTPELRGELELALSELAVLERQIEGE